MCRLLAFLGGERACNASVAGGGERIAPYLAAAAAAMGEQIILTLLLSRAGEWELSTTKIWVVPYWPFACSNYDR